MKNILILFLIISSDILNAQTSVYHPFPDSGIIWREQHVGLGFNCCCSGPACAVEENYQYFLGGDTLIGLYNYKKIFKTGNHLEHIVGVPPSCPPWCTSNDQYTYFNYVYMGGLRQDTALRKVFFIHPLFNQDTLLYDFNLNVGDTLPDSWNNYSPFNHVSSIDSILIGANYRKRFMLSCCTPQTVHTSIIEGIGSEYGLLYHLEPPFEFNNYLGCVLIDSIPVYTNFSVGCQLVSEIKEVGLFSFSIFPNPFNSFTTVQLESDFEDVDLKIYDFLNQLIMHERFNSKSIILNRNDLSAGIYIIQIINKKGNLANEKIIIE